MRGGTEVYKYDHNNNLIHTYSSIHQAQIHERVGYYCIARAIYNGSSLNGHFFLPGKPYKRTRRERITWEGVNGFFNVEGYAKMVM